MTMGMHLVSIFPEWVKQQLSGIDVDLSDEARLRLRWFDYYQKTKNVSLTCRHFGVSRKTFYKWKKRYNPWNLSTLNSYSRCPKRVRRPEIPLEIQDLVVSLRKNHPTWSKYKLQVILKRDYKIEISSSSIGRILKRRNLILYRETKRRIYAFRKRKLRASRELKVTSPGDLLQLDTKHFWLPWGREEISLYSY